MNLSIIIPVCNEAKTIADCLGSILSQLTRKQEVLLADYGSDDGTMEVVATFHDARLRVVGPAGSYAEALNRLMEEARGEYVVRINADCIMSPGRLRRQLRFPPFCDIALMTLSSADEAELLRATRILSEKFSKLVEQEYSDIPLLTFGPFEAPVYRVDSKYRMRMVIKCRLNKRSRAMFSELLTDFSRSGSRTLNLSIDFNPSNL